MDFLDYMNQQAGMEWREKLTHEEIGKAMLDYEEIKNQRNDRK